MGAMSDYLEAAFLNHVLRNTAYTKPWPVYVALYTSNPGEDNSGSEVGTSGPSGYARQAATFNAPSGGAVDNAADVTFPEALTDWGEVTHVGIMDAETSGNLLFYGELTTHKTITTGDQFKFKAGDLEVSAD